MSPRLVGAGVLLLSLALSALGAHAQRKDEPVPKSPAVALGVSLGVAGAGAGVMAVGVAADSKAVAFAGATAIFVGPSVGRWYARKVALGGLLVRTIGLGVMIHGAHVRVTPDKCVPDVGVDCTAADEAAADRERRGNRILYGGAALLVGAALWDIVWAPLDAREHNRAHGFAVAPTLMGDGAGLAVGGSF